LAPRRGSPSRWRPTGAARCSSPPAPSATRSAPASSAPSGRGGTDDPPPAPLDAAVTFAPAGEVVVAALKAVDRGGTVVVNAIHLDRIPEFAYEHLWWERSIRSVANFTRRDAREFLALAAEVPILTETEVYPLDHANQALADLAAGRVDGAAVLRVG